MLVDVLLAPMNPERVYNIFFFRKSFINCCFGQIRAKHLGEGEHGDDGEDHGLHPLGQRAHKDGCRILQGDLTIQLIIRKWQFPCSQIQKQAEANRLLLTPEYLELKKIEAISSNNKVEPEDELEIRYYTFLQVYFGPDIPNMFLSGDGDKIDKR